jgi:hypothetical protein
VGRPRNAEAHGADRKRPVVIWQSDALTGVLASVLVVPLTTNLDRAHLAGTAGAAGYRKGACGVAIAPRRTPGGMVPTQVVARASQEPRCTGDGLGITFGDDPDGADAPHARLAGRPDQLQLRLRGGGPASLNLFIS